VQGFPRWSLDTISLLEAVTKVLEHGACHIPEHLLKILHHFHRLLISLLSAALSSGREGVTRGDRQVNSSPAHTWGAPSLLELLETGLS
jgi:hypothetical protein